jgi:hypothetical protein
VTTSLPASATGPLLLVSFVGFSLVPTPLPTPFGMLRLDPANVVLLPGTATATSLASPLAIPNVPALNGARLYFQSLVEGRDLHGNPELRLTNAMGETLRP